MVGNPDGRTDRRTDGPTLTIPMSPPDFVGGYNKAFRERQHPSALDQWTNSPFMGQQVGNYKSFPLCIHHHIQLISLSFQVSQPSCSWYSNFNILPWKPKVKVIGEVKIETTKWV